MRVVARKLRKSFELEWIRSAVMVVVGSMVIALSAPFTLPLPFTVVPLALQMNVVFLVAHLLGPRRGPAAVWLFLMQGLAGLSVFAGGTFGIAGFIGPRGGYLFGYFIAAHLISRFNPNRWVDYLKMYTLATFTVYFFGFVWLSTFIGFYKAFLFGIAPFIVGDLIKLICISPLSAFKTSFERDSSK